MSGPSKAALRRFEDAFGKALGSDTLRRTGTAKPYETISTGSVLLDFATGVGGYVEGRIHEIWGPESTGKTTLCLNAAREAQAKHPSRMVGFIDMEQTLDEDWAQAQGVDLDRMYHYQPDSAEDVADALKMMLQAEDRSRGLFSLVIVDSIGGMISEAEMEKDAGQSAVAEQARIVTRMVKAGAVGARRRGITIVLVNQVRAVVAQNYGPDTTTGGGWALKHATTMKLKTRRTPTKPLVISRDGDKLETGVEMAVLIEKNKVAPPKRTANVWIFNAPTPEFGSAGIDKADEAVGLGLRFGWIEQNGAWYQLGDAKRQGRQEFAAYLRDHPEVIEDLRQRALAQRAGEVVHDQLPEPEET